MEFYKGIIFDFNGTLFFDSEMHLEAWREFSAKLRGYPFSDEEMRKHMFGRTNKDIITYALGETPSADFIKTLAEEKEGIYRERCRKMGKSCKLAPYAVEFLDYLKAKNIPRTIATMSDKNNVDFFIEHFELEKWFDVSKIVYDDGRIKGKPEPDIYLKAAKNLNLHPEHCVVVEDAVSGIEAANKANIGKIVAIASMEDISLYKSIPCVSLIIKDFKDFDTIISADQIIKNFN